jgi:hypothetical protein
LSRADHSTLDNNAAIIDFKATAGKSSGKHCADALRFKQTSL